MYHLVYLTSNLINGKIYIGVRSTYNLEDGYLGSGIAITKAIDKYGRHNFKRSILYYCLTRQEALDIETNIVDCNFISKTNTYNVAIGGYGGNSKTRKGKTLVEIYGSKSNDMYIQLKANGDNCIMSSTHLDNFRYSQKDKKKSAAHKTKISEASLGKPKSDTHKTLIAINATRRNGKLSPTGVTVDIIALYLLLNPQVLQKLDSFLSHHTF